MALFGDVGTGKTTLCRALLRELPREVQSALVLNPHLSDAELIGAILDDLGVPRRGATRGELMTVLGEHLLAAGEEGKTVVVILDEAQQMSVEALEQIRILSNLETPTRKLLQIVLVGQPELEDKLEQHQLRQLDQRIGIRCHLPPLSRKETFRYIEHRMRAAGLSGTLPFTTAAMLKIFRYSRGIPRVINLVCDRALMAAYSARAREVHVRTVTAAIRNLEGRSGRRALPSRRTLLAASIAGLVLLGVAAYWSGWAALPARRSPMADVVPAGAGEPVASGGTATAPTAPSLVPIAVPAPPSPGVAALPRATSVTPEPSSGTPRLLAQALRAWGVTDELSPTTAAAWPTGAGGLLDIAGVAARYQLSATFLPATTLEELRGIGLPALLELEDAGGPRVHLLQGLPPEGVVLVGPAGENVRLTTDRFESLWTRSAWIVWRNVDQLPLNPLEDMSPIVVATVALRLQKLGLLEPPLPRTPELRFQEAVREFQRRVGLPADGVVGPRTTLALSRVVAGRFGPSVLGP
jgi:general secretion pathway protein A